MPTFTIHTRHSWPPGNYTPRRSTTFNPTGDPANDVDENPFAFYLSPPPPPLDYDYDTDPESDAGITTTPPRSRSRSPFSLRSRSNSSTSLHQEEDEESTIRKAGRTPGAVLRRWAGFVERTYPHLTLANLRSKEPSGPATVVVRDQRPASPDGHKRGRGPLAVTLSAGPPGLLAAGGGDEVRGRGRRRRSRSWQPPGEELWTVLEDEEDEAKIMDSGEEEEKLDSDAEELDVEEELARKVREDVGMSLSYPGPQVWAGRL